MTNLNEEQSRAVNHINGPCLVLAGPGSGKTHTLVERIRHMIEDEGISPKEILVITFSKKAAEEMQERFERIIGENYYPVYFGTFHAVFYNILKQYHHFNTDSVMTESKKRKYLDAALSSINIENKDDDYKTEVLDNISKLKSLNYTKKAATYFYDTKEENEEFEKIYEQYMKMCHDDKQIDFDDMLYKCYELLLCKPDVTGFYQSIYKYFLVDEFQDINDIQYEILMMLAGVNRNIFAVGDDDQSIYGFRGSDPKLMKRFRDELGSKVINLDKNYRCAECVINAAARLINKNIVRISKSQIAMKENKSEGIVEVKRFDSEALEAEYICETIQNLRQRSSGTFAIIYRTSRCVNFIEEKLRKEGIAYIRKGDRNSYYEEYWIKDIITYIRIAHGDTDISHLYRIMNRPWRNITRDDVMIYYEEDKSHLDAVTRLLEEIKKLESMTPYASVNYILKALKYEEYVYKCELSRGRSIEEIKEQIFELLNRAKEYKTGKEWIFAIDVINNMQSNAEEPLEGRVQMLTAHASKGLEFDTVFIAGLQEGVFPHRKAITKELLEEERRLMYVAMTRAKMNLFILGRGEEKYGKKISGFIKEICT